MKSAASLGFAVLIHALLASTAFAQSVFISELADPRLNYQSDRFIEIYNAGPAAADLTGWSVVAVGNGSDIFTWNLSGLIQPGEALVMGDLSPTVAYPVDFPAQAWSDNNGTWNGKVGDGAKLVNAASAIVDYAVVDGTHFENQDYVRDSAVTTPSLSYNATQWAGTAIDFPTEASPGTHGAGSSLPVITAIQTAPAAPAAGEAVSISADITDALAILTTAELRWGTASNSLINTIAMSPGAGDTWTTDSSVPAQLAGSTVYFEIQAFNDVPTSTITDIQSYSLTASVSIYDIQGQLPSSPYAGSSVRTQGVVTAVYGSSYVIQDGLGAWSGLWVDGALAPIVGDLVDVQGDITESLSPNFDGTTFLANAEILGSSAASLPAAAILTASNAFVEAQEGVLTKLVDAECAVVGLGAGAWLLSDGSASGRVGELGYDSTPTLGTRYDVVGPLLQAGGLFYLEPRSPADIVWSGDTFAPLLLSAEADDLTTVRATFTEQLDASTAQDAANYAISGATVTGAALVGGNPAQVLLSTTSMASGAHTLTVNGVEDLFGNAASGLIEGFDVSLYAPPAGYYSSAEGLTGVDLRAALHLIIDNHTVVSYSNALNVFVTSDDKPNGKVWDMYSDNPGGTPPYEYTFGVDNGASANAEGQGYNREHSWPRSWFGGAVSPMNSDLFQLYPTDIYMNSIRGSYPYGEVSVPNYTSANGTKRGPNTYPGYSGVVFEPIDEYKGDFARGYFYMGARYYTEDGGWPGSVMTDGSDLEPWAENMLYDWHVADPVSDKERERNHVIFSYQDNRNPFIDRPEFVAAMLGLVTAVEDEQSSRFSLRANFPNPFESSTSIQFELDRTADITVEIFDVRGRRVKTLASGSQLAGTHLMIWDGTDGAQKKLPSGIYYFRLASSDRVQTRKMILLR